MPAIVTLTISALRPVRRTLSAFTGQAGRRLKRLAERIKNRKDAMRLAALDDRMLADMGLNRSDLRDAFSQLPWRDPSEVLARRAAERRAGQRLFGFSQARAAPPSSAHPAACYPPANRPARYLV